MTSVNPRLLGAIGGAIALAIFIVLALGWRRERDALREWRTSAVSATREASGNAKLAIAAVPRQIRLLGQARVDLEAAIVDQNAKIRAIAIADHSKQAVAAKARLAAEETQRERSPAIGRLEASARAGGPSPAPCAPSKTLQEYWK